MTNRVDSLIEELSTRHANADPGFLAMVRPLVEKILDDGTPSTARVTLLELLAETFERDVQIRADVAAAQANWHEFVQTLMRLLGSG